MHLIEKAKLKLTCQSSLYQFALSAHSRVAISHHGIPAGCHGRRCCRELVKRISGREEPVQDENEVLRGQHDLQRPLQVRARAGLAAESRSFPVCTI